MGLNTNQGIHLWRHRRTGGLMIKIDGSTYMSNAIASQLERQEDELSSYQALNQYSRIAVHELTQYESEGLVHLVKMRYTFRKAYE